MLLTFHSEFVQVFVTNVLTHLLMYFLCTYQIICFFTYSLISEKKQHNDTKHVTPQDQIYCFDYFFAVKL